MLKAVTKTLKIKRVFIIVVAILMILESFFVYLTIKSYSNKVVEKVEAKESKKKNFNTYVQNELTGTYEVYNSENLIPENTNLEFDVSKSYCEDFNGVKLDNVITRNENGTFTMTSDVSAYCFIYFTRKNLNFASQIIDSGVTYQTGLDGDGYRFTGSGDVTSENSPSNFVCFGTTDRRQCKREESKYLYRIIGVFQDSNSINHVKLIKYQNIGVYAWHSTSASDVSWESSDMFNGLNGSYFLTNTNYEYLQDNIWSNKITNWVWSAVNTKTAEASGPDYNNGLSPSNMFLHELNRSNKTNSVGTWSNNTAKIGLMYASDYALSLGATARAYTTGTNANKDNLKTGWLHQSNINTTGHEYTISRPGIYNSIYRAYVILDDGSIRSFVTNSAGVDLALNVRPVFYLNNDVTTSLGDGTYAHPFILTN